MTTAAEIVQDILEEIGVLAAEEPIQAADAQKTIRAMNNFMLAQDALGTTLGYTKVSDLGDLITVPDGAILGVIKNVAVQIAPSFGMPVGSDLRQEAKEGLTVMNVLGFKIPASSYPSTFPIGSGNEGSGAWCSTHFYQPTQEQIAAETTGNIALESNTNEVADG